MARDAGARLLSGANVRVTSNLQGTVRTSVTNANGSFLLDNPAPGSYTLVVSSAGFADVQYTNVQVEAGRAITLDTTLPVATTKSMVDVAAAGTGVDLQLSLPQGQITSHTIESIPLNGLITDPATGISDSVTILDPSAKSWYDGLLASVSHRPSNPGRFSYQYNISYTLSKTFDYSNDDQLENGNQDEQVNLGEGTAGLRREKGYSLTDERHRLTFYGEGKLPYGFSLAPIYTFGSGVLADTFLPGTASERNGSGGSRLPLLPRNALAREIKNSNQLNAMIDKWNALPACPAAAGSCNQGGALAHVPANVNYFSPFSSLDLRLQRHLIA